VYHTTGFTKDQITDLCVMVHSAELEPNVHHWPPILGLFKSVVVALTYMRRNRVQAELAEYFGVSQPTISRAVTGLTPVLARLLVDYVPTAEDLDPRTQYIVDGTLLPCWSWRDHPELYSGKHKTTGLNVQVVCDLDGRLAWISDPVDGRRHDTAALGISGVLRTLDPANWMGDKGYIGNGMLTPIKKPPHRELLDWEKEFNTAVNKIRYRIERTIANIKTWRILHVDYRRPLTTFATTISAVVALEFYRASCE
jgi:hypothetical protein